MCREISKLHEESVRGTLAELVDHFTQTEPRGEIVIVVGGADKASAANAAPTPNPQRDAREEKRQAREARRLAREAKKQQQAAADSDGLEDE